MADKLADFRKPEDAEAYYRLYDRILEEHWPTIAHEEIDIPGRFGTTRVRRTGYAEGTPIVMLHPTQGGSIGLTPFIGPLAQHHCVYTPDVIGTPGRSVQTAPMQPPQDWVTWLDETLDALGLDRVHLAGYSEGGYMALLNASMTARPERLATVTLLEPGGALATMRTSSFVGMLIKMIPLMTARNAAKRKERMREFSRWFNGDGYESTDDVLDLVPLAMTFRQTTGLPKKLSDDQLRRITMPTHLMLGDSSRLFDAHKVAGRARRLLPEVTVDIRPGGHGFGYARPEEEMARVLAFIADHERGRVTR
ncbi:alpha/beta fold hydrolase [Millisia brevis]|uniref:alpha/beta fold hydrolase n=1 Tax=Millisia brevis TaxID=264148 RepID=UPI000830D919|nr:alpha/beta hydrolase [Millisia brevis]